MLLVMQQFVILGRGEFERRAAVLQYQCGRGASAGEITLPQDVARVRAEKSVRAAKPDLLAQFPDRAVWILYVTATEAELRADRSLLGFVPELPFLS